MPFRLSTKGHYAVLLMYELARSGEALSSLNDIASVQNISQGYLEQIIRPLRAAELVTGRKGFGGGYVLAKPASEITVGEVIRAVEGPVVPVKCVGEDPNLDSCPQDCRAKSVWQQVGQAIDDVLDSITLEDLVTKDAGSASLRRKEE
ncbi:MAG: RrF2 family transcriptional regulator [Bacillota bacterium]